MNNLETDVARWRLLMTLIWAAPWEWWSQLRSECKQIETLFPKGAAEIWAEAEGEIGSRKFVLFVCFWRQETFYSMFAFSWEGKTEEEAEKKGKNFSSKILNRWEEMAFSVLWKVGLNGPRRGLISGGKTEWVGQMKLG